MESDVRLDRKMEGRNMARRGYYSYRRWLWQARGFLERKSRWRAQRDPTVASVRCLGQANTHYESRPDRVSHARDLHWISSRPYSASISLPYPALQAVRDCAPSPANTMNSSRLRLLGMQRSGRAHEHA